MSSNRAIRSADGRWIAIGANTDHIFLRLAAAMQLPDLLEDGRFLCASSLGECL
ncbi:hypothetical protein [Alicyclobacillus contaminans]|uniref:hypothetical protein n=1 Tax=Alicyclobacillus contaminans TaxID=392016 RepID=UPI003CCBF255